MAAKMAMLAMMTLLVFVTNPVAYANDPDPLQDICVADLASKILVNGFPCKPEAKAKAADFFFNGLAKPGVILENNTFGSIVTAANVMQVPGLNTLGVSMARIDYAPGGINPPHIHPRATEMVFVLRGKLDVGFVTTANRLFTMTIYAGQNFVFPRGLVHFQKNNGKEPAALIAGFNSQNPGVVNIALTLFAANPPFDDEVLAQTFQVSVKEIQEIKARFAPMP